MSTHALPQTAKTSRRCACGGKIGADGLCDRCRRSLQLRRAPAASPPRLAPSIVHDVLASGGARCRARQQLGPGDSATTSRGCASTPTPALSTPHAPSAPAPTRWEARSSSVLASGRRSPRRGTALLLHELTHVAQQGPRPPALGAPLAIGPPDDTHEREAERAASGITRVAISNAPRGIQRQLVTPLAPGGGFGGLIDRDYRRTYPYQVCARRIESSPYFNHTYIKAPGFTYAVMTPWCPASPDDSVWFGTTAKKWDNSPDPCGWFPTCVPCYPKPGVADVGQCLRSAFDAYSSLSFYRAHGPNSNTFAGTLARACCLGMESQPYGFGLCPGWDQPPAPARRGGPSCANKPSCKNE